MRTRIAAVTMAVLVACAIGGNAASQPTSTPTGKREDIRRLLELSGSGKMGVQVISQMVPSMKKALPTVPERFWKDFEASVDPDELVQLIVPIYEKHFTHEEIEGLIHFYETPLGKKLIKTQPLIVQESMQVGQEWGRDLAGRVARKMQEEGYK